MLSSFLSFVSFSISEEEPHIFTFFIVLHIRVVGGLFPTGRSVVSEDWEKWCATGLPGG